MLLNSVNPIDYVLDIAYNKKGKEKENEKNNRENSYKNLKQDEEEEEMLNNSNAINFNESERESPTLINSEDYNNNNTEEHNQFYEPRTKSKIFNYIVDKLFLNLTRFLQLIGPLFCISIVTFLIYTYISIIKNIFPYWYQNYLPYEENKIFYFIYKCLISLAIFFSLFNYLLAVIIKPGNISDIRKSKYYKTHSPYYSENLEFPLSFIKKNHLNQNNQINYRICKYCKEVKPLRTHHCSLCGRCVIKMDHHCPWINNCIGQNNHRYFLLFLFHVLCYTVLGTIFTLPMLIFRKGVPVDFSKIITKNNFSMREVKYISVLGISSFVIEIFFAGWNWFLAINGNTTLEFWADRTEYMLDGGVKDYSFGNWRKNLYYIFGEKNLFKILFVPSIKKLPFSGIEITKFVDQRFSIEGIN